MPTNVQELQGFHDLATFYRHFICNFSSVMAPTTESLKKGLFQWTKVVGSAFENIKVKITKTHVLALPDFIKVFRVTYDVSHLDIGVLRQEGHPIAFFSKFSSSRTNMSKYDFEFYNCVYVTRDITWLAWSSSSIWIMRQ